MEVYGLLALCPLSQRNMCAHPRVVTENDRVPAHDHDLGDGALGGGLKERGDVSVSQRVSRGQRAEFPIWMRSGASAATASALGHLGRAVLPVHVLQGYVVRQGRVPCGRGQWHGLLEHVRARGQL